MLDGLGSDAKTEHALSSARVAEHEIATAGYSGQTREIPFDDVAVVRDGHVVDGDGAVTWYKASDPDSGPEDAPEKCKSRIEGIGALEYTVGDRTIAYQSGGIWQRTDDETRVHSPPISISTASP